MSVLGWYIKQIKVIQDVMKLLYIYDTNIKQSICMNEVESNSLQAYTPWGLISLCHREYSPHMTLFLCAAIFVIFLPHFPILEFPDKCDTKF